MRAISSSLFILFFAIPVISLGVHAQSKETYTGTMVGVGGRLCRVSGPVTLPIFLPAAHDRRRCDAIVRDPVRRRTECFTRKCPEAKIGQILTERTSWSRTEFCYRNDSARRRAENHDSFLKGGGNFFKTTPSRPTPLSLPIFV